VIIKHKIYLPHLFAVFVINT